MDRFEKVWKEIVAGFQAVIDFIKGIFDVVKPKTEDPSGN